MSDTPRTDAQQYYIDGHYHVSATLARELERECAELKAWKESALLVESRWDCQRVAKLLGITLGHDIRPNIEPKIRELLVDKARLDWLQAHADEMEIRFFTRDALHYYAPAFSAGRHEILRHAIDTARESEVADSMRQAPVD